MTYLEKIKHTHGLIDKGLLAIKANLEGVVEKNEELIPLCKEGLERLRLQRGDFKVSDIIGGTNV